MRYIEPILMAVFVVAVITGAFYVSLEQIECEDSGGLYVRRAVGWPVCIRAGVVK